MMARFLWVGLGGAIGAIFRYIISLIPWKGDFPVLTLVTNLAGAVLIGVVVGLAAKREAGPYAVLFLKTGVCGGFTTFSTFSLESLRMLEQGQRAAALLYILLSVADVSWGVAGRKIDVNHLVLSIGLLYNKYITDNERFLFTRG